MLPVGLLSAVINLMVLKEGVYDNRVMHQIAKELSCTGEHINPDADGVAGLCVFPGKFSNDFVFISYLCFYRLAIV